MAWLDQVGAGMASIGGVGGAGIGRDFENFPRIFFQLTTVASIRAMSREADRIVEMTITIFTVDAAMDLLAGVVEIRRDSK